MYFRKAQGVSWESLRTFLIAEVYIKRGKRTLTKRKILDWSRDLDIDTLNERNRWAILSELSKVIPFHSDCYDDILKRAIDGNLDLFKSPSKKIRVNDKMSIRV